MAQGRVLLSVSLSHLKQLGVDQEAEPEGLQHIKDETLCSVEKAKSEKVSINE